METEGWVEESPLVPGNERGSIKNRTTYRTALVLSRC